MSVKVSLSVALEAVKDFPTLMIDKNKTIVLFSQKDKGVVISSEEGIYSIGDFYDNWAMSCFKGYEGEITLKNE
jgi:hypothetical protein